MLLTSRMWVSSRLVKLVNCLSVTLLLGWLVNSLYVTLPAALGNGEGCEHPNDGCDCVEPNGLEGPSKGDGGIGGCTDVEKGEAASLGGIVRLACMSL